MPSNRIALAILALSLVACGEDSPASEVDAAPLVDAAVPVDAALTDANASGCTYSGFSAEQEVAERDTAPDVNVLFYTGRAGQAPEAQHMSMDFYFTLGATDGPHTVTFDGENLSTCHSCFLVRRKCGATSCISGQVFLAQEGTAEFTELGAAGERMKGTIRNAVLAEVTIESGLNTVLVPGGETWCIDNYAIDLQVGASE